MGWTIMLVLWWCSTSQSLLIAGKWTRVHYDYTTHGFVHIELKLCKSVLEEIISYKYTPILKHCYVIIQYKHLKPQVLVLKVTLSCQYTFAFFSNREAHIYLIRGWVKRWTVLMSFYTHWNALKQYLYSYNDGKWVLKYSIRDNYQTFILNQKTTKSVDYARLRSYSSCIHVFIWLRLNTRCHVFPGTWISFPLNGQIIQLVESSILFSSKMATSVRVMVTGPKSARSGSTSCQKSGTNWPQTIHVMQQLMKTNTYL